MKLRAGDGQDALQETPVRRGESELRFVDTRGSTEWGALKGGPIGVAAGAEYRRESLRDTPDPLSQAGEVFAQGSTATDGERSRFAMFGESSRE